VGANKRVFYAIEKAGIAPLGSTTYTSIRGLQTIGLNTTFNLEQVMEFGQATIYENVEGIPNVEATLNKVLDGFCPMYLLATQSAQAANLLARANASACSFVIGIYSDQQLAASGSVLTAVTCSGMYVSSASYKVGVDGNATEDITLVGNNKLWSGSNPTINDTAGGAGTILTGDDSPLSITGSGGVNRREDVLIGSLGSIFPSEIPGISSSGYLIINSDGSLPTHLRSISVTANLGREDIFELGRKGNYYRYVKIPAEVTSEIGVLSSSGDMISALEEGAYSEGGSCGRYNLTNQRIVLKMCEGLIVDAGDKNKLQSVNWNGGGTDGSNQELVYSYRNFNDFIVYHPQDPNAGTSTFQYPGD
jgi:hypothetical protein